MRTPTVHFVYTWVGVLLPPLFVLMPIQGNRTTSTHHVIIRHHQVTNRNFKPYESLLNILLFINYTYFYYIIMPCYRPKKKNNSIDFMYKCSNRTH